MIPGERGEGWVVRRGEAKEERWAVVRDPHNAFCLRDPTKRHRVMGRTQDSVETWGKGKVMAPLC